MIDGGIRRTEPFSELSSQVAPCEHALGLTINEVASMSDKRVRWSIAALGQSH
jgi:hypothetical protein